MARSDRWIIVGAGASGLAAAYFLKQRGIDSILLERERAIGGRMGTVPLGGRSLDCGGKNIGRRYHLFRQFARSLGTHPLEYFGLNSSQVIDGELRTFEASARWQTLADLARGVPVRDAIRFGRLLWRVKRDESAGYLGSPYARRAQRYDDQPVNRLFSREFCDRIVRPMSVRMNGAEPDEVYWGNFASNARMLLDTYDQFAHGLDPLLSAFRMRYDVRLDTTTEGLLAREGRVTGVRVRHANGTIGEVSGAGVILATPANIAAALTEPLMPGLARELRSISYYPVTLVVAEYDRPIFSPAVRAIVFDAGQAVSNAGAYGVNDLHLVRYTFSGGTYRRHLADDLDAETLLRLGEASLSRHVSLDRASRRRFAVRHFHPGLCAYTPHHGGFLRRVNEALKLSGLHLTGDYMQGASIEACFRSASACATRVAALEPGTPPQHAAVGRLSAQLQH
jgi:oxygen-dependent protoporphyrinogen oxidase